MRGAQRSARLWRWPSRCRSTAAGLHSLVPCPWSAPGARGGCKCQSVGRASPSGRPRREESSTLWRGKEHPAGTQTYGGTGRVHGRSMGSPRQWIGLGCVTPLLDQPWPGLVGGRAWDGDKFRRSQSAWPFVGQSPVAKLASLGRDLPGSPGLPGTQAPHKGPHLSAHSSGRSSSRFAQDGIVQGRTLAKRRKKLQGTTLAEE